jgi:alpha-L-rhamnosidase
VNFSYESSYGTIASTWKVTGNSVVWSITIPPNATGLLPVDSTNAQGYLLDGVPIAVSAKLHSEGPNTYRIPAGTYTFRASVASPTNDLVAK